MRLAQESDRHETDIEDAHDGASSVGSRGLRRRYPLGPTAFACTGIQCLHTHVLLRPRVATLEQIVKEANKLLRAIDREGDAGYHRGRNFVPVLLLDNKRIRIGRGNSHKEERHDLAVLVDYVAVGIRRDAGIS